MGELALSLGQFVTIGAALIVAHIETHFRIGSGLAKTNKLVDGH